LEKARREVIKLKYFKTNDCNKQVKIRMLENPATRNQQQETSNKQPATSNQQQET
jgi:hypothetical protein